MHSGHLHPPSRILADQSFEVVFLFRAGNSRIWIVVRTYSCWNELMRSNIVLLLVVVVVAVVVVVVAGVVIVVVAVVSAYLCCCCCCCGCGCCCCCCIVVPIGIGAHHRAPRQVSEHFDRSVDKSASPHDWGQRPLSMDNISYLGRCISWGQRPDCWGPISYLGRCPSRPLTLGDAHATAKPARLVGCGLLRWCNPWLRRSPQARWAPVRGGHVTRLYATENGD